jgi:L-threonylcarbamoyladenylate synthase
MNVVSREEFKKNEKELLKAITEGALFVYPTDTIYGLGCDATNSDAVQRVREAKQQFEQPFSVIVPSKEWIRKNCEISSEAGTWLDKLPGPYTLILKLKNATAVAQEVTLGKDTLGVRIPHHWFSDVAAELMRPLVTTSANLHGKPFMTTLEQLDTTIKDKVGFVVYEGPKDARPSTIVDLTEGVKVIAR